MKFVISREELNKLLGKVQNIVPTKPTVPILANFLVEAMNNELILTASDLTVGVRCSAEVKIEEEGATTLPAKHFIQLVRELTSNSVEVTTNANEITTVNADSSHFKLHGSSRNEFPTLPDMTGATHFKLPQSVLKEMFFRTSFAVSREDNRYALTGVLMKIEQSMATFVGTDGKRLSRSHLPLNLDASFSGDYIIPLKAVEEIHKSLGENDEATIFLMKDKIAVQADNTMIVTKLLSGEYPDVNRVIPEKAENAFTIHRDELISLLRQISLFAADSSHSVRFSFAEGELNLSANTIDVGEGKVSMPVNYRGPKMDIAFNPGYFLDILRHSKKEVVSMGLIDSFNPAFITDNEEPTPVAAEATPLFVIMPMRLNEE